MEYRDFIVNAGLRLDYFDPRVSVPADPADPNIHNPIRPDHAADPLEVRQTYWWRRVEPKYQLSPRIALAYPISDAGVIHVSYGHFFQRPAFEILYTNPYYKWDVNDNLPLVGNPDLQAERTVSFEVGLQQALSDLLTLDATIYNRDIRNLVSTDRLVDLANTDQYVQYVNRDFGYVRGGVITLERAFSNHFSFSLAYTLQFAQGNASDRNEARRALQGHRRPSKSLVPLDWDRRHTLNGNFQVDFSGNAGVGVLAVFGSGLPYTPEIRSQDVPVGQNENSGRKPYYFNVDFNGYWRLWHQQDKSLRLTLQVLNLLDRRNENDVFASTGRAGYDLYPHTGEDFRIDPNHWSRPREVTAGLTLEF
jgi:outer membrane receptor protein involved in Fe transport